MSENLDEGDGNLSDTTNLTAQTRKENNDPQLVLTPIATRSIKYTSLAFTEEDTDTSPHPNILVRPAQIIDLS